MHLCQKSQFFCLLSSIPCARRFFVEELSSVPLAEEIQGQDLLKCERHMGTGLADDPGSGGEAADCF